MTAIVLAKNEEAGIGFTLNRLDDFDEVIVVDSWSTDRTVQIAQDAGATVVQFTWNGGHPKKKQWSLDHAGARNEWVLLLDADEYPSAELVQEIADATAPEAIASAYDIELDYWFAGRVLEHGHRVTKRSLLRRSRVRFPEVNDLEAPGIREVEGHYQPEVIGETGRLQEHLQHDDVDPVSSWFDRHNRYSDWEAYLNVHPELKHTIAEARSAKGQRFARLPFKPAVFFGYSYLLRRGFLDGRAGFDYAFALASYYWQIGVKTRELRRDEPPASDR
ncbi:glycosyltransferase family 2 protein [uncultured Amnibacterium sp.]|uniref:glycosyltransferase family 2 protein n=1 Tax=uncultured Amnibacterium sp. TaxID=1631851 RepID=UPI0035CA7E8C